MEHVHGTNKLSKSGLDEDVISRMPENVITNILDRLPLEDAVGTSVLSTNWRFNWTMISQLIFNEKFFEKSNQDEKNIISRILSQHKGSITKFVLVIPHDKTFDVDEVSLWVMYLSSKGIKDFTLLNLNETPLNLPSHPFSCLELKYLNLRNCSFQTPSTFCGFPNLVSLDLRQKIDIGKIVEFIANSPLLEILKINCFKPIEKVKLVEIAKLKNLKKLSLPLCMFDDLAITCSTIFQLGGYLPKLQHLTLGFQYCKFIGETGARISVRNFFPCLKTLNLYETGLNIDSMLSCAIEMIWASPNLKSLHIIPPHKNDDDVPPPTHEVDYNALGQLQLQYVYIGTLGSVKEVRLIKHLLGRSPFLKKITIESSMISNKKLKLAKKLLKFPRASTIAVVELRS